MSVFISFFPQDAVHKSLWEGQSGDKSCNTLNEYSNAYTTERPNISYYCKYRKIWQDAKSHVSKTFGRKTTRSKWPKYFPPGHILADLKSSASSLLKAVLMQPPGGTEKITHTYASPYSLQSAISWYFHQTL